MFGIYAGETHPIVQGDAAFLNHGAGARVIRRRLGMDKRPGSSSPGPIGWYPGHA